MAILREDFLKRPIQNVRSHEHSDRSRGGGKRFNGWALPLMIGCLLTGVAVNSLVAAPPETNRQPIELQAGQQWHVKHPTHHVQGLCVTGDFFWISSVDRGAKTGWIYKVDRDGLNVVSEAKLVDGPRFHPGGMQLVDNVIWVPLAEYRRHSSTVVLALDANTLAEKDHFLVDDHLGAVAVEADKTVYAANWDAKQIYRFDIEGKRHRVSDSPTAVAYQDIEYHHGYLWGTGRAKVNGKGRSVVDVLDGDDLTFVQRIVLRGETATVGEYFAREGLSVFGKDLYLMPEDGPETRIYQFPVKNKKLLDLLR